MANKERNKRSARKARARERAELEAAQAASAGSSDKQKAKAVIKAQAPKPERAASKSGKPGFFTRVRNYFADVRTEMHRVVWPSKTELKNYSVAVIVTLIVFGVAVWLVDTGFVALLVAFTSLRGA